MFTISLIIAMAAAIYAMIAAKKSQAGKGVCEKKLALLVVEIRYLKQMVEVSANSLETLKYAKERDEKIEQLISYIERGFKIPYGESNSEIIQLDDFRQRYSA